jgi:NTP pyrophosphatase (non-canonical NTP hydrolase)
MSTPTPENISCSTALGWVNIPVIDPASGNVVLNEETGQPLLSTLRYDNFVALLLKADTRAQMCNHAVLGVCGEAGELADCIKKEIHYGHELDRTNLVEELGDLRFYIQAVMNLYGVSEMELLQHNANKLSARYNKLRFNSIQAAKRADKTA